MAAQQLIPVFTGELTDQEAQSCNARDLHRSLKVGRDFSNWIKGRIDEYGFARGVDFEVFDSPNPASDRSPNSASKRRGGQNRIDYHLTLDMAKELAMIENNEVGRQVRRYFIQCENILRAELRDKARHVLGLPGIKSIRSGISFKQTVVLQKQSRDLMQMILAEPAAPARVNLHRQLRQVNDALGIPTDPLDDIVTSLAALEG